MSDYGDTFNAAVAAELRGERAKARITVKELVASTGYAKTTVLNYLNGKRDIPMPALADLCRALGVEPRHIFERVEEALEQN